MSDDCLFVYKDRTNTVNVELGYDVSEDEIVSEIREGKTSSSELIATWSVEFLTDGVDGKLVFKLDDSLVDDITQKKGYMDMKRIHNDEPLPVIEEPIKVRFKESVTA